MKSSPLTAKLLESIRQRGQENPEDIKPQLYEVIEIPPETSDEYENIRDYDPEHVTNLAESILIHGQLQESVGLRVNTPAGEKIVIIAGKHRRRAIIEINKALAIEGLPLMNLRVRVYNGNLSKEEIFEIQLAENLQKQMTPTQKADTLYTIWLLYLQAYDENTVSFEDLAKRSGQSAESISAAVKFGQIDKKVAQLARDKYIPFSVAVALSGLPKKKQIVIARHIILQNLSKDVALSHIGSLTKKDRGTSIGLFGAVAEATMAEEAVTFGIKRTVGEQASVAAAYFERILYLLRCYSQEGALDKLVFTEPVIRILSSLIQSSERFKTILNERYPFLLNEIQKKQQK